MTRGVQNRQYLNGLYIRIHNIHDSIAAVNQFSNRLVAYLGHFPTQTGHLLELLGLLKHTSYKNRCVFRGHVLVIRFDCF